MKAPANDNLAVLLIFVAGPLVWFVHLSLLYAAETIACLSPEAAPRMVPAALLLTSLAVVALAAIVAFQLRSVRAGTNSFEARVGLALSALSAGAVALTATPALLLQACFSF